MKKVRPQRRQFHQECRLGVHWAKLTVEWSEHPDTPENWKANAEAIAEKAFMESAGEVRKIVHAQWGKSCT